MKRDTLNIVIRVLTLLICMKTCSACGVSKDESEFGKQLHRLRSHCKPCVSERVKAARKLPGRREAVLAKNKAYYLANTDKVRAVIDARRALHPEKVAAEVMAWREKNRDHLRAYAATPQRRAAASACSKAHYHKNKKQVLARDREYRIANADKIRNRTKIARQCRTSEQRARQRAYRSTWRKANELKNPTAKVLRNLRRRIGYALNGRDKSAHTAELLGCNAHTLRVHLEGKFKPGMSWKNYRIDGWHVDHVRPCASFDLSDPEQQRACFHYTNLQPLWWYENIAKGNKIC